MTEHTNGRSRREVLATLGAAALAAPLLPSGALAERDGPAIRPGDSISDAIQGAVRDGARHARLMTGDHGKQAIARISAKGFEIVGEPGAQLGETTIRGSTGLTFRNVAFRGEKGESRQPSLVMVGQDCSDIAFDGCSVAAVEDSSNWGDEDWVERPHLYGLTIRGEAGRVTGCRFFNLRNCLAIAGRGGVVKDSAFERFGNDAINFRASDIEIVGNRIRGSHHSAREKLHSDGIQGLPAPKDGIFENVVIEGNQIEFSGPGDYMQGISIFDGRWKNMRIARNTVRVNVWNAIAAYGIEDLVIEKNVVSSTDEKVRNWIEVRASKSGAPSTGVTLRDNVAPVFKIDAPGAASINNLAKS